MNNPLSKWWGFKQSLAKSGQLAWEVISLCHCVEWGERAISCRVELFLSGPPFLSSVAPYFLSGILPWEIYARSLFLEGREREKEAADCAWHEHFAAAESESGPTDWEGGLGTACLVLILWFIRRAHVSIYVTLIPSLTHSHYVWFEVVNSCPFSFVSHNLGLD